MRQFAVLLLACDFLGLFTILACGQQPALADQPIEMSVCDDDVDACDILPELHKQRRGGRLYRTPAMIGDFFSGAPVRLQGNSHLDSLLVWANDLDVPLILPGPGSTLSLSEPGPVGIYTTSLVSIQQLQASLRTAQTPPRKTGR